MAKPRLTAQPDVPGKLRPASRGTGAAPRRHRDLPDFDRLIHERIRLGIVSVLAVNDSLSFNDLKRVLKTTDGNLSVHARKLEEAGYITCCKFFEERIPHSQYRLTPQGRKALEGYLGQMEAFIAMTRERSE